MVDDKTSDIDEVRDEDEGADEESEGASPKGRRGGGRGQKRPSNPRNATELLTDYLAYQASKAATKLRQNLIGKIGIEVRGLKKSFLVDWSMEEFQSGESDDIENVDCRITLTEDDLLEVAKGKLNPQVAMLSHKIHVSGNLNLAMYFFNLFATRVR